MMAYYPTIDVLGAVGDQLSEHLAEDVDTVVHFDGGILDAIADHFQQPTAANLKTVVFFGLSDDLPDTIAGSGLAIRPGFLTDIYVVVRSDGRSRYADDLARLFNASDKVCYTAFHYDNTSANYRKYVGSNEIAFRRRAANLEYSYLAHVVRFEFRPRTP